MDRRKFLISGAATIAVASLGTTPALAMAKPVAPYVKPTTNVIHLAGRIATKYRFEPAEVLRLLGLEVREELPEPYATNLTGEIGHIEPNLDDAKTAAEQGDHEIFERARMLIEIKRKLNLHFNFDNFVERDFLDLPSGVLNGRTFRQAMKIDLRFASSQLDKILES